MKPERGLTARRYGFGFGGFALTCRSSIGFGPGDGVGVGVCSPGVSPLCSIICAAGALAIRRTKSRFWAGFTGIGSSGIIP